MKIADAILMMIILFTSSFAQYILKSRCIDDGGIATVTSGGYKMGCSVSQSFIGKVSAGGYIAYIGYWTPGIIGTGIQEYDQQQNLTPPITFNLQQNYPNPVSFRTAIKYSIASKCEVELKLFDITGRLVTTLIKENQEPGYYQVNWNIHNVTKKQLPNGVYFYRLTAGDYTNTKKMVVVR